MDIQIKAFYRCSGVFDARCSMPPTSWEEMKMDFKSDRKSRIFHLLFCACAVVGRMALYDGMPHLR